MCQTVWNGDLNGRYEQFYVDSGPTNLKERTMKNKDIDDSGNKTFEKLLGSVLLDALAD